jgi:hypothetical protein
MTDENHPDEIPPHHSGVRHMWAQAHGEPYEALVNLSDARKYSDSVLIMEADSGGQILLTCPVRYVLASEETLLQLLCDLETITWGGGGLAKSLEPYDADLCYEVLQVGAGVAGGMGGGLVVDGLWLHKELCDRGLKDQIAAILTGQQVRLTLAE